MTDTTHTRRQMMRLTAVASIATVAGGGIVALASTGNPDADLFAMDADIRSLWQTILDALDEHSEHERRWLAARTAGAAVDEIAMLEDAKEETDELISQLWDHWHELLETMLDMPATTAAGILFKIDAVLRTDSFEGSDIADHLIEAIEADLNRMNGTPATPAAPAAALAVA